MIWHIYEMIRQCLIRHMCKVFTD